MGEHQRIPIHLFQEPAAQHITYLVCTTDNFLGYLVKIQSAFIGVPLKGVLKRIYRRFHGLGSRSFSSDIMVKIFEVTCESKGVEQWRGKLVGLELGA